MSEGNTYPVVQWMRNEIVKPLDDKGDWKMAGRVEQAACEIARINDWGEQLSNVVEHRNLRAERAEAECERLREMTCESINKTLKLEAALKRIESECAEWAERARYSRYPGEVEPSAHDMEVLAEKARAALSNVASQSDDDVRHKAASGEQVSDKWRPIEMAPKDREILVAYKVREDIFEFAVASYLEDSGFGTIQSFPDMSYVTAHPTHWMPLPTPPKTGGENAWD